MRTSEQGFLKLILSQAVPDAVGCGMRFMEDPRMMQKSAATIFGCEYNDIQPDKDHVGIHVVALGDFETYGCFFAGAPVQTLTGCKPIEQIQVGDMVLTHKNRYRRVLKTYEQLYDGNAVAIEVSGLPEAVMATGNHPFHVVRAGQCTPHMRFVRRVAGTLATWLDTLVADAEWLAADQVRPGDYMIVPCNPDDPEQLVLPEYADPYVMGLYVAEGCLAKEYKHISTIGEYKTVLFTVADSDRASIDYLQAWALRNGRNAVAELETYTSEKGIRLGYGFKAFAELLDKLFGHTAVTKRIHPAIFKLAEQDRLRFLAGYMDGDGSICTTEDRPRYVGTIHASTVSRQLALDIQKLAASVSVPVSVSLCHNYERNRTVEGFGKDCGDLPIYALAIGATVSNRILEYCLRLRPHNKIMHFGGPHQHTSGNYLLCPVRKVTITRVESVHKYNLEVAEDNSYVVDVQGHNSNRNGDSFKRAACIKYHDTFVKHGSVFRNHNNKDRDKRLGDIVKSAYNSDMGRIELFLHVDKKRAADELQKLARDGTIAWSMACRVPYDTCNICGTMRKSAADPDQCDHVRYELRNTRRDGSLVCTHNDLPTFFDISFVNRPADRIAWDLKVAGDLLATDSYKLAEDLGLWVPDTLRIVDAGAKEKLEMLHKLAALQQQYMTWAHQYPHTVSERYLWELRKAAAVEYTDEQIQALRNLEPEQALHKLARMQVVLPAPVFFKYAFGLDYGELAPHMPQILEYIRRGNFIQLEKCGLYQGACTNSYFDVDPMQSLGYAHLQDSRLVDDALSKEASFTDPLVNQRVIEKTIAGESPKIQEYAGDMKISAADLPIVEKTAEIYAAYKLSALRDIRKSTGDRGNGHMLMALSAVQDLVN
jgi:hypothetical protein